MPDRLLGRRPPFARQFLVDHRNQRRARPVFAVEFTASQKAHMHDAKIAGIGDVKARERDVFSCGRWAVEDGVPIVATISDRWRTAYGGDAFDAGYSLQIALELTVIFENARVGLVGQGRRNEERITLSAHRPRVPSS